MKKCILIICFLCFNLMNAQNDELLRLPKNIQPKDRICFAMYTVHENTLKLTAQFNPIRNVESFEASLEIQENGKWVKKAETRIIYPGYTAPFRVEKWDDTKEYKYRVNHNNVAFYEGIIKRNPVDKDTFVMAALTCNSIYPNHGGDISRKDLVDNIKHLNPDLIFFSGDQVYDHSEHYLYWLKFGREFGEILRNTPSIIIPDDHDIGHGNLWGQGGKRADSRRGISGGYYMPAEYVKEVERAQTSHLPDPYDPTPVEQGIGVYYTDLKWGGMSFAILEDRKFKDGLDEMVKQNPDIFPDGGYEAIFDPKVDTRKLDVPTGTLLGERQLKFLEAWTTDWENAEMKSVLSQTTFAMVDNYTGKYDKEILADFDSNGWPQSGRNRALIIIRKSFSPTVCGDTHLGTLFQNGIDNWNDASYSFATPAIANYWLRWWEPKTPGNNRLRNDPLYTGEYYDGFKNKITVKAAANPTLPEIKQGGYLSTRAAGFGVVKYNKKDRTITFDCWARNVDIADTNAKQYPGWPYTIAQTDNFNIKNGYELPTLKISKQNQVVTVMNHATKEVVSSIRIKGNSYQPKVLNSGKYYVIVGEGNNQKRLQEIEAKRKNKSTIQISI